MAVDLLKSRGVPEERILFLNVIASPEGVTGFARRYPNLRVVTAFVDQGLDEKKCVSLGSFVGRSSWVRADAGHPSTTGTSFRGWATLGTVSIPYERRRLVGGALDAHEKIPGHDATQVVHPLRLMRKAKRHRCVTYTPPAPFLDRRLH